MKSNNLDSFKGKKVLVTGHTGFKGSWLCHWLVRLGASVVGISKDIPTEPSIFKETGLADIVTSYFLDLADTESFLTLFNELQPDIVFHLAAQPIVLTSYNDPLNTMRSNVVGTLSVVEALRNCTLPCVAVLITSDKAYDNIEQIWGYREDDKVGGKDIYSASKGAAELVIRGYFESFLAKYENIRIGIARAGNVIGGGDWADHRIVVDCMLAWSKGEQVSIRNPNATRPWQHVLEPLYGYLCLASNLLSSDANDGEAFNFGPEPSLVISVEKLISDLGEVWDIEQPFVVPDLLENTMHEAQLLKLDCDKARALLGWTPKLSYPDVIQLTAGWYYQFYQGGSQCTQLIKSDIDFFEKRIRGS